MAVLKDYQITTKVGYFMADNATNNDRAIEVLKNDLNIEPHKQRLRCACHILNLVVKAMLYGVDSDCIDNACNPQLDGQAKPEDLDDSDIVQQFEAVQRVTDEQARLRAWRKKDRSASCIISSFTLVFRLLGERCSRQSSEPLHRTRGYLS